MMTATVPVAPMRAALARLAALPSARAGSVLLEPNPHGLLLQRRTTAASARLVSPVVTAEGTGRACVSFDKLNELVGRLTVAEVTLRWDAKYLHWKTDDVGRLIATPESDLEPELPEPTGVTLYWGSDDLRDQLATAGSAMFTESGRDYMRGVLIRRLLGRVGIAGLDGRRFHCSFGSPIHQSILPKLDESGAPIAKDGLLVDDGLLLQREQLPSVVRLLGTGEEPVEMTVGRNSLQVRCGDRLLRLACASEVPGDIESMAIERPTDIQMPVDRAALLAAVRKALPLGRGDNRAITLFLGAGHLWVDADDGQGNDGHYEVPIVPPSRSDVAFRVSAPYLVDFLEACPLATVPLGFLKQQQALVWRSESRVCVVQCMRDGSIPPEQLP